MVELDRVFVCAAVGAPVADRLVAFGLTGETSNSYPSQDMANRRFFFRNATLELSWAGEKGQASSPSAPAESP